MQKAIKQGVAILFTLPVAVFLEFLLLEVGVALHLVHSRYNLGRLEQTLCLRDCKVGDSDCLYQSLLYQFLHALYNGRVKTS